MTETPVWMRGFLRACLNKPPAVEVHRLAERAQEELLVPGQDSEVRYYQGTVLAACGEQVAACGFLCKAVAEKCCARVALEGDPLLVRVRSEAEFREIVQEADECQQRLVGAEAGR